MNNQTQTGTVTTSKSRANSNIGFRQYIQKRRITDTRQGDFTADARRDKNLPNAKTWKELEYYFDTYPSGVCDEVYKSAKLVWTQYRARFPARHDQVLKE